MRVAVPINPPVQETDDPGGRPDPPGSEALLLTVPEAARLLAIGRTSLYRLIGDGDLRVVKIGRATRVPLVDLRAFVDHARRRTIEDSSS